MKIEVNFDKFKQSVNKAINAVMKVGQNTSLKGVYFEVNENEQNYLLIRSTNIDIGFECMLPCKTDRVGNFLISGDVLSRLLSSVNQKDGGNCFLNFENGLLNIKTGKHEFVLKTLSFESFPKLPKIEGVDVKIDRNIFLGGLKSVVYSVAKSEIKPEISGVFIRFNGTELVFVATDAYRLAEKKYIIENELPEMSFIIPEKNIKEILRIMDNSDKELSQKTNKSDLNLVISKNSVQIQEENTFVVTRLIEGNFPNYTQIIPSNPVSFSVYLKEDLIKSLRLVGLFSDKTNQIMLNVEEGGTSMEASNNEVGNTKESINSTLKGDIFSVKLNSKYLEEFLQNINDQSVVLKFTAQNKAILVQGLQDANYTYLLMPSYR